MGKFKTFEVIEAWRQVPRRWRPASMNVGRDRRANDAGWCAATAFEITDCGLQIDGQDESFHRQIDAGVGLT